MKNLFGWLDGKKTALGMIAAGALTLCWQQSWINEATYTALITLVGTWTGVAIAHKANKAIDATKKKD